LSPIIPLAVDYANITATTVSKLYVSYVRIQIMLVFSRYKQGTGAVRLTHHRDMSYALLVFVMLGAGTLLASFSWPAHADTPCKTTSSPKALSSQSGCSDAYTVTAVVPGPRPTREAIITSPVNGQSFSANPVNVSGTCPAKALIKVFTNGILVGSVLCIADDTFTVPVDLVIGHNDLTALPYNTTDEVGPTSPTVSVTLNEPVGAFGFSSELVLQSENYYRGSQPGQEITWPIDIVGGEAPYAVNIDWGDGTSSLITRLAPGPFTLTHTYAEVGTGYLGSFPLIIRATDSVGHTAYLQLTTIVNSAKASTNNASAAQSTSKLLLIWPIWIVLLLMIISFWLGERREKRIMERRLAALA
jgi:hypothetical protein